MKPRDFTFSLTLAAWIALQGAAIAQSPALLDSYGRAAALLDFMTAYVGESLLVCAERDVITEEQAEARFRAYRERNAALLERAATWRQEAEKRLRALGQERTARERADGAGMSATAEALARVQVETSKSGDVRATCTAKFAAIESGRFDLSVNAEFVDLLKVNP